MPLDLVSLSLLSDRHAFPSLVFLFQMFLFLDLLYAVSLLFAHYAPLLSQQCVLPYYIFYSTFAQNLWIFAPLSSPLSSINLYLCHPQRCLLYIPSYRGKMGRGGGKRSPPKLHRGQYMLRKLASP